MGYSSCRIKRTKVKVLSQISNNNFNNSNSSNNNNNNFNRKFRTWDFSARLLVKKKIIDSFFFNDKAKYSSEMKSFGVWTKTYLIELGPTFIKLGQTLSTRTDIFPPEYISELSFLQDQVEEIDKNIVKELIETELSQSINSIFKELDLNPYKSASLGQVHKGILNTGIPVAVKIQRPGVKEIIINDIDTIAGILDFLDNIGYSPGPSAKSIFFEAKDRLLDELDYTLEAKNAVVFRTMFKGSDNIIIPRVYNNKSTSKMLIMEWVPGIKITDLKLLDKYNIDKIKLCKIFIESFLIQTTKYGIFHADPHPGNVAVSRSGKIILYDYGLVVRLPANIISNSKDIITAVIQKDTTKLVDIFIKLGIIVPYKNKYEIAVFFGNILNYLEKVEDSTDPFIKESIINKLSDEKPFIIPSSFIFLGKTVSIIEGICLQLDQSFNFIDYIKPFAEDSIMEAVDIQKIAQSTLEMPYKINFISNSVSNLEQQKNESDIKINNSIQKMKDFQYSTILALFGNYGSDLLGTDDFSFVFNIMSMFFIIRNIRRR